MSRKNKKADTTTRGFVLDDFESVSPEFVKQVLEGMPVDLVINLAEQGQLAAMGVKALPESWRPWSFMEAQLRVIILSALQKQFEAIVSRLQASNPANLPDDINFWEYVSSLLFGDLINPLLVLTDKALSDARSNVEKLGLSLSWDVVNKRARDGVDEFVGDRITKITETTRKEIAGLVGEWIESGDSLDSLIQAVYNVAGENGRLFSTVRAEMIATTEATNAYARANARFYEESGFGHVDYKPSAHVRCRCWLSPRILSDKSKVVIWNTAFDDRVCDTLLDTPWGDLPGCGELHLRVVSTGAHTGEVLEA